MEVKREEKTKIKNAFFFIRGFELGIISIIFGLLLFSFLVIF
jgi:hypothetical protein